ncbi:MAG: hypothetical protein AAB534_01345 [Patescibacteria group bacterium]
MADSNNQKDVKKDGDEHVDLKGLRTLDGDLKEYKKNLEKYGEDQVFSYDPYLSTENDAKENGAKTHVDATQVETKKESKKVEKTDENSEEDIPFIELLKNRKNKMESEHREDARVYSIDDLTPTTDQIQLSKEARIEKKTPKTQEMSNDDILQDEENTLRENLVAITKEHAEWKQKLEYYKKNQSKVLEEREDFVLNKEDIEKMLNPILEEEKKLESVIKVIEDKIEATTDEDQKRTEEKNRWGKEDQRQKLEREKWAHMEDLSAALKLIEEKDKTYETLVSKQNEAESKLVELEKTKQAVEAKLRLREIKRLKIDIETNKTKLEAQIKNFKETIERLNKIEKDIILEKKAINEKEHRTKDSAEEKIIETKRWEVEDKLRKVEQERWQSVDKQKRLVEIMNDINEQYSKITREEKENLSKIHN